MLENPRIIRIDTQPTAVVRATVPMDEMREFYDRAFPATAQVVARQQVGLLGAVGHYLSTPGQSVDIEAGLITDGVVTAEGEVVAGELPGGEVVQATHVGSYDGLGDAWRELYDWAEARGRRVGTSMWEVYVTEPTPEVDPATLRTDLFWPLA